MYRARVRDLAVPPAYPAHLSAPRSLQVRVGGGAAPSCRAEPSRADLPEPSAEPPADLLSELSAARSCLQATASGGCGVQCLENRRTQPASGREEKKEDNFFLKTTKKQERERDGLEMKG